MKHFLKIISVIFYLILVVQVKTTFASHAAGAEISYVCLGSGNYELTFTFYRDCFGINPNTSMDINILNDCGFPSQTVLINQLGTEVEIQTVCPGPFTSCNGGTVYAGYQKWTYRGIINLQGECNWYIGHGEPARNASITTITGSGSDIQYVYCMINNVGGICNNSPSFNDDPIFNYCTNQLLLIEPEVIETDRDSLVYELIIPRTGPTLSDTVTYLPGYSYSQPLICNLPMTFDPVTGVFRGIPAQTDVTIYAMAIKEYRNGVLIGQVERDMMLSSGSCTNSIPVLTGFNGTNDYFVNVFANQLNCFFVTAVDPNLGNQAILGYNNIFPGVTYTNSGGQRDTSTFCWTPTPADTLQNPYCIRVNVSDGNCPILGISARNYYLNVQIAVGVDNIVQSDIAIWPNPFTSEINLSSSLLGKVEIKLFDIQGRQVMNSIDSESNATININLIEKGIYLLSIKSLNTKQTFWKRVIKD